MAAGVCEVDGSVIGAPGAVAGGAGTPGVIGTDVPGGSVAVGGAPADAAGAGLAGAAAGGAVASGLAGAVAAGAGEAGAAPVCAWAPVGRISNGKMDTAALNPVRFKLKGIGALFPLLIKILFNNL